MYQVISQSDQQHDGDNDVGDVNDNWEVAMAYDQGDGGLSARAKAREALLTTECLVCGGKAAAHHHYGAVCCYSCRHVFIL